MEEVFLILSWTIRYRKTPVCIYIYYLLCRSLTLVIWWTSPSFCIYEDCITCKQTLKSWIMMQELPHWLPCFWLFSSTWACNNINADSMWGRFFHKAELERMVDQDLSRLYPEHGSYFQSPGCQGVLRRILLLWCIRHPNYGYQQGNVFFPTFLYQTS